VVRGLAGNFGVDKAHGAADQRVDGIGHAEVGPTVAAGTGDQRFEAARSQRFGGYVIGAGAVEHTAALSFARKLRRSRACREDCFAFFANVSDEKNGALGFEAPNCKARASARTAARPVPLSEIPGASMRSPLRWTFTSVPGGKNGVEMRGKGRPFLFHSRHAVRRRRFRPCRFVRQAGFGQQIFHGCGAQGF